jgi:hypothetical protein
MTSDAHGPVISVMLAVLFDRGLITGTGHGYRPATR